MVILVNETFFDYCSTDYVYTISSGITLFHIWYSIMKHCSIIYAAYQFMFVALSVLIVVYFLFISFDLFIFLFLVVRCSRH